MSKQLTEFDAAELTTPLSAHLKVFEHDARRFWPHPRQNAASSRLATQKMSENFPWNT